MCVPARHQDSGYQCDCRREFSGRTCGIRRITYHVSWFKRKCKHFKQIRWSFSTNVIRNLIRLFSLSSSVDRGVVQETIGFKYISLKVSSFNSSSILYTAMSNFVFLDLRLTFATAILPYCHVLLTILSSK